MVLEDAMEALKGIKQPSILPAMIQMNHILHQHGTIILWLRQAVQMWSGSDFDLLP